MTNEFAIEMFAVRIRCSREARQWSLDRMAKETGLSKTFVWELEKQKEKTIPSVETLVAFCKAFEVSADYLLFGK